MTSQSQANTTSVDWVPVWLALAVSVDSIDSGVAAVVPVQKRVRGS